MAIVKPHFILYVKDQAESTRFYTHALACLPSLDVPGMTEFSLSGDCVLGLMPEAGVQRLLGGRLPNPSSGTGIPRCELYLTVDDPLGHHRRAIEAGAVELSALEHRDWGDRAAYSLDPDGHVLVFAERSTAGAG